MRYNMAIYGMKDAANITIIDKATQKVALFIDYANATSSEWTAERVFATKKGTQAIAWDSNRTGTLTLDSEMFDLGYLALAIGSDVEEGENDVFRRKVVAIDATREAAIEGLVDAESVSAIRLEEDLVSHAGQPLPSTTGNRQLLPELVRNVVVNANAESAVVTFDPSLRAVSYEIKRDGDIVGTSTSASFTDTGLTPVTQHEYVVTAINEYGNGAPSAPVEATTADEGVTERVAYEATAPAKETAELGEGELNANATSMVTFEFVDGKVRFNENAQIGANYAVYYMEGIDGVRTINIDADKFPSSFEVFADAQIREQATGKDDFIQIHYKNARPQSNFSLTQSATEPTSLSVVFDLFPDENNNLAEMKIID